MNTEQQALIQSNIDLAQKSMLKDAYIEQLEAKVADLTAENTSLKKTLANVRKLHREKCADYKKLYERYLEAGHGQSLVGEMLVNALPGVMAGVKIAGVFGIIAVATYFISNI